MKKVKFDFIVFLIIEIALLGIISYDAFAPIFEHEVSNLVRLAATFIFTLFAMIKSDFENKSTIPLILGSVTMILCDFCMLILGKDFLGVIFFIITALLFTFYINNSFVLLVVNIVISTLFGIVASIVCNDVAGIESKMGFVSIFYIVASLFNLIAGLVYFIKQKRFSKQAWFYFSIVLLFLCDICIGIYAITGNIIFNQLEWVFYVPCLIFNFIQQYLNMERYELRND